MTSPVPANRHLRPVNPDAGAVGEPPPLETVNPTEATTPAGARRVLLTPAAGIRLRPTHWIWDGRMPQGAITVAPGREGIGKSLFCAWLAARVTLGELPGVHYGTPKGVIYAATEDSWERTLAGRLVAAGADLDRVFRVEVEHIGHAVPLSLPRDCAGMAEAITDHDVALLIVDPLISAVDATINPNQDADLRGALEPLASLADTTGSAVFGLAHFNKSQGTDVLSRITGSRAFAAVARAAVAFARDTGADDGSCVISQAKNNLGRLDLPSLRYVVESVTLDTAEGPADWGRLVITGETDVHVNDLLDDTPTKSKDRDQGGEVAQWLTEFLTDAGGSAPANEIYAQGEELGYSDSQIRRARKPAKIPKPTKDGMGGPWTWRLPTEDDEDDEGGTA